jgi:hypothetical protein
MNHLNNNSMKQSPQLGKKLSKFYRALRFITKLTRTTQCSHSEPERVKSTRLQPISLRSYLILSSHLPLRLPIGLFRTAFPTKTACTPPHPMHVTCPPHPISLYLNTRTIYAAKYESRSYPMTYSTHNNSSNISITNYSAVNVSNEDLYLSSTGKLFSPLLHFYCHFHDT